MQEKLKEFYLYLYEKELAPNTIKSYEQHLEHYFSHYNELSKVNLIEWKKKLSETLKPKSVNHYISMMNIFTKWLNRNDLELRRLKIQMKFTVDNVINKAEFDKLLDCLKTDRNIKMYYICLFLGKTGARVSELRQFKLKHLKDGFAEIPTKGKIRRVYFCNSLRTEEIYNYFSDKKDDDYLFESRFSSSITARGISQNLISCAEKYGIRKEVMHPHSFRHFFAIEFLKRDKDIALLADLMGHSSTNTTCIYLRLTENEQINRLNNAMNF